MDPIQASAIVILVSIAMLIVLDELDLLHPLKFLLALSLVAALYSTGVLCLIAVAVFGPHAQHILNFTLIVKTYAVIAVACCIAFASKPSFWLPTSQRERQAR